VPYRVRARLPEDSWSIDLLKGDVALRYSKEPGRFRREALVRIENGTRTIFIEEIQKLPELLDEVHHLVGKHDVRFILTGSSARKLKRGGANMLAGRALTRHLHPLTCSEQGGQFDLGRNLRLGSLPEVIRLAEGDARVLLSTYVETYFREEIRAEALVRDLGGFARFLDLAASQCGDLVNFSAIGRDAGLRSRTVQEYYEVLEDTLVGFRLESWRKSPRARLVAHPKFFLFDTGVTNALNRRLTAELDPVSRGRLFEQWFILECRTILDYAREEARLFFWRTRTGVEVDLLIEKHNLLRVAVEIKSKQRVSNSDLRGLRSFGRSHPDMPLVCVAPVPEEYSLGDVRVVPYQQFLSSLLGWLD